MLVAVSSGAVVAVGGTTAEGTGVAGVGVAVAVSPAGEVAVTDGRCGDTVSVAIGVVVSPPDGVGDEVAVGVPSMPSLKLMLSRTSPGASVTCVACANDVTLSKNSVVNPSAFTCKR